MKALRNYLDKIKPSFEKDGKLHAFRSLFDGFETFLFVPNTTAKKGVHIHDAIDSKRIMSMVVIALMPALLFGMYNVGYQNALASGIDATCMDMFIYGMLAVLPKILVSYVVGLGIEFAWAQWKGEEIQEGFLVSGILIPLIVPVNLPLWMLAIAVAFAVIIGKEIFGGTGMNIFNPALMARAFLFFAYPQKMTGDQAWISDSPIFGFGGQVADGFSGATPLANLSEYTFTMDAVYGLIPGSIGETSVIAIAIGAVILLCTGIASWKIMLSVFAGGILTGLLFENLEMTPIHWYEHIALGGFCFGAVFMATDPVTSSRTECGKWIYGFMIGVVAIVVRVMNPGFPEGMMLAILLMNMFAPAIDYFVVDRNISKRLKRGGTK
ncbi:NADH:ubiquinone reductase (Na(+)-transporting) subunit B [Prevotella sp. E2-28]|uniref:NADH:ubiquinone reductase (Na(+)-transporting) subunit B n=1 Tax=Prevotella sp. E2-28 TaxID=2913620 RepID=UPI001EDA151B|nr:NADH:ubiquinone reductase (Na(+)-transporting) subunit B [Prevotella sp. E2-28]UKK54832.1 NADH:ubiquinone reductase (Na(+)-transporting) subunit B [Prevotella sp. E2-28]